MTKQRKGGKSSPSIFRPPLLITECADDYRALQEAFVAKLGPLDIVEEIYVADFVAVIWDIERLRRCKPVMINQAYYSALCDLIAECSNVRGEELRRLAQSWFTDADARHRVDDMLAGRKLDASAVEAKALCSSVEDLEQFERILSALESRRDRALRGIFEYRRELALQLERNSNDIIASTSQLKLQPPTAA